jgi:hypothetical protein
MFSMIIIIILLLLLLLLLLLCVFLQCLRLIQGIFLHSRHEKHTYRPVRIVSPISTLELPLQTQTTPVLSSNTHTPKWPVEMWKHLRTSSQVSYGDTLNCIFNATNTSKLALIYTWFRKTMNLLTFLQSRAGVAKMVVCCHSLPCVRLPNILELWPQRLQNTTHSS